MSVDVFFFFGLLKISMYICVGLDISNDHLVKAKRKFLEQKGVLRSQGIGWYIKVDRKISTLQ